MGEVTKIQWTHHTFNPWIGCTKVAPECANCYAEEMMAKRWKRVGWGDSVPRERSATWRDPVKWNRAAEKAGERRRVFCASLADVFEDKPELVDWRKDLFNLIDATPWLDWLLLTKRPENIRLFWLSVVRGGYEGCVRTIRLSGDGLRGVPEADPCLSSCGDNLQHLPGSAEGVPRCLVGILRG